MTSWRYICAVTICRGAAWCTASPAACSRRRRLSNFGYAIGVGGTITYTRASKTRNTLAQLPLDALLLETDTLDMPLHGFQGEPNRPERAHLVWKTLCELSPELPEAIAEALWRNTQNPNPI